MVKQTGCFSSVFKNVSGHSRYFGYLSTHGVDLEGDEEYTAFGNPDYAISQGFRKNEKRIIDAFLDDVANERIQVISVPNPILFDADDDAPKMVTIDNGVVVIADPCYVNDV